MKHLKSRFYLPNKRSHNTLLLHKKLNIRPQPNPQKWSTIRVVFSILISQVTMISLQPIEAFSQRSVCSTRFFLVSSLIVSTQHSHGGCSAGCFFGMIIDPLPLRSSHPCALGSPSGPGAGVSPGQAPTVAWANPGRRIFMGKIPTRADSRV